MYRPIKFKSGWLKKATPKEIIESTENYLYEFMKTDRYDSGVRLAETEAYLQGLKDCVRLHKNIGKDND